MQVQFEIGMFASFVKKFNIEDATAFANLTGDMNPIHIDVDFASKSKFKKNIVHGAFINSLFSTLLAEKLPGPGTIYLGQNTKFLSPVYIGDEVLVKVEIIAIRDDKPIITLKTTCKNVTTDLLSCEGEAIVLFSGVS